MEKARLAVVSYLLHVALLLQAVPIRQLLLAVVGNEIFAQRNGIGKAKRERERQSLLGGAADRHAISGW